MVIEEWEIPSRKRVKSCFGINDDDKETCDDSFGRGRCGDPPGDSYCVDEFCVDCEPSSEDDKTHYKVARKLPFESDKDERMEDSEDESLQNDKDDSVEDANVLDDDSVEEDNNNLPDDDSRQEDEPKRGSEKRSNMTSRSIRNYDGKQYQAACTTPLEKVKYFRPCRHRGKCTSNNCSCVQAGQFCTLECCNGRKSKNFFRGCECNGNCSTNRCSCHAANRECDPELCGCKLCSDSTCKNANITMGTMPLLYIRESMIPGAGRGCFAGKAFKKGDFIGEYTGELLTEDQAARREKETREHTYLFTISSDRVLDARFHGNATRFINHSAKNCNVKPRRKFVEQCFIVLLTALLMCSLVCSRISEGWPLRP